MCHLGFLRQEILLYFTGVVSWLFNPLFERHWKPLYIFQIQLGIQIRSSTHSFRCGGALLRAFGQTYPPYRWSSFSFSHDSHLSSIGEERNIDGHLIWGFCFTVQILLLHDRLQGRWHYCRQSPNFSVHRYLFLKCFC